MVAEQGADTQVDCKMPRAVDYPDGVMFSEFFVNTYNRTVGQMRRHGLGEDAHDAAQEAYLKLYRKVQSFRGERNNRAYGSARRHCKE